MSEKRPDAPPGNYAALDAGARLLARIECGNYGEENCQAWKLPGGLVVLAWGESRASATAPHPSAAGETRRIVIVASDELVVCGKGFVASNMAGIESALRLIAGGKDELLTHFEMNMAFGGTSDEEAAAFARIVATEAGCKLTVQALVITDSRK